VIFRDLCTLDRLQCPAPARTASARGRLVQTMAAGWHRIESGGAAARALPPAHGHETRHRATSRHSATASQTAPVPTARPPPRHLKAHCAQSGAVVRSTKRLPEPQTPRPSRTDTTWPRGGADCAAAARPASRPAPHQRGEWLPRSGLHLQGQEGSR